MSSYDKADRIQKVRAARQLKQQDKMDWIEVRKEERAARNPQQQIARLDYINGKGMGAKKERARLAEQIAKKNGV